LLSRLLPDLAEHFLDVLGKLIVHVSHETPSKDHLGSSSILTGMCNP
jgi:hypothetical protein